MNKQEKRMSRKQDLQKLTLEQLGNIPPYKNGEVTALKTDASKKLSANEMIEAILLKEGLGGK